MSYDVKRGVTDIEQFTLDMLDAEIRECRRLLAGYLGGVSNHCHNEVLNKYFVSSRIAGLESWIAELEDAKSKKLKLVKPNGMEEETDLKDCTV